MTCKVCKWETAMDDVICGICLYCVNRLCGLPVRTKVPAYVLRERELYDMVTYSLGE